MKKLKIAIFLILIPFLLVGVVKAATKLFPYQGGTGSGTAPTVGQMLVGTSGGVYEVATDINIQAGNITTTGIVSAEHLSSTDDLYVADSARLGGDSADYHAINKAPRSDRMLDSLFLRGADDSDTSGIWLQMNISGNVVGPAEDIEIDGYHSDLNITGDVATSNTLSVYGYRSNVNFGGTIDDSDDVFLYGGHFTGIGTTGDETVYGGWFSATGGNSNYGIWVDAGDVILDNDDQKLYFGEAQDAYIEFDGDSWNFSNLITQDADFIFQGKDGAVTKTTTWDLSENTWDFGDSLITTTGALEVTGNVKIPKYKYSVSPQLESIFNNKYRDGGYERFTVSDDGITYIHDLVNDPDRDCVWGITRAESNVNYVFRIDRDGTVTKVALGGAGAGKGMFIAWGGDYLWGAIINTPGNLLRIDPDTLDTTFYELDPAARGATCLTYDGTYIFVGTMIDSGTTSEIYRFNVSTEDIDEYTINDVYEIYWALYDGTYSWFSGEDPVSGNAKLIKMATDGTYSTYDLGDNTSGSEITYDGTYIYQGSNDAGDKQMIRFDTRDNSIDVIELTFPPRCVGFDGQILWLVATDNSYTRMSTTQSLLLEESVTLTGSTYTHGLTFDGLNAWIGTWQNTCYIYRVPMVPLSTNYFDDIYISGALTIDTETFVVNATSYEDLIGVGIATPEARMHFYNTVTSATDFDKFIKLEDPVLGAGEHIGILFSGRSVGPGKGYFGFKRSDSYGVGDFVWYTDPIGDDAGVTTTDNSMIFNRLGHLGVGTLIPDARAEFLFAGTQLKLSYDATNEVTFAVQSDGDLTLNSNKASYDIDLTDADVSTTGSGDFGEMWIGTSTHSSIFGIVLNDAFAASHQYNYAIKHQNTGKTYINASAGQPITFRINDTERMAISATGVLTGNSSSGGTYVINDGSFTIEDGGSQVAQMFLEVHSDTPVVAPQYLFTKTRGTKAAETVVVDDDRIGAFMYRGHDGTDNALTHAAFIVNVDGSVATDKIPMEFVFEVTKEGEATRTEALKIRSSTDIELPNDNQKLSFGLGGQTDSYIQWDTTGLDFYSSGGIYDLNATADTDITLNFTGTTNSGVLTWMEDEGTFDIHSATSGTTMTTRFFTNDGDGTDDNAIRLYGVGTQADQTNSEFWQVAFAGDTDTFEFSSLATGTGTIRDFYLYTEGYSQMRLIASDGSTRIGTTSGANYTQFAADGTLALVGTAKVLRSAWMPANTVKGGGTSPATWATHGISGVFVFAVNQDDEIIGNVQIPPDMDTSVAPTFLIGWSTNDTNEHVCEWKLEYLYTAAGENTAANAQDTDTDTDQAVAQADGLNVHSKTLDVVGATDVCMHYRLTRLDSGETNDTIVDSVELHGVCFQYTSNKLGE